MYALITENKEKIKYFVLFGIVITILLLVSVVFKNDENIKDTKTNFVLENKFYLPCYFTSPREW